MTSKYLYSLQYVILVITIIITNYKKNAMFHNMTVFVCRNYSFTNHLAF